MWHCSPPRVLKFYEGKRRASSPVFQVNIANDSVFIKHVLHVFGADIGREIPYVYPTVVAPRRSSNHTSAGHANASSELG